MILFLIIIPNSILQATMHLLIMNHHNIHHQYICVAALMSFPEPLAPPDGRPTSLLADLSLHQNTDIHQNQVFNDLVHHTS
jgi:hypothetical protein